MSNGRLVKAEAVISTKKPLAQIIPLSCQERNRELVAAKSAAGH
jgi:hypothetical protein